METNIKLETIQGATALYIDGLQVAYVSRTSRFIKLNKNYKYYSFVLHMILYLLGDASITSDMLYDAIIDGGRCKDFEVIFY